MNNQVIESMRLSDVERLRSLGRQFTATSAAEKAAYLERMASLACDDASCLVAYHDCLLFLLAYPQNDALRRTCEAQLQRVAELARGMAEAGGDTLPEALHGSGLPWTRIAVTFNYQVATWLARRFPEHTRLHAVRGEVDALRKMLGYALPAIEFESLAQPCDSAGELLSHLGGDGAPHPLRWLLGNLASIDCPEVMKRRIHSTLRVFVGIDSRDGKLSRSTLRGLERPIHYHDAPLRRSENVLELLDAPLPKPIRLGVAEKMTLLEAARGLLALLGRQTEPISDCNGRGVYAYDLGRGVVIGLFSAAPADRPPLDSHIGMMLFKNGMPIAYGGGWPFLGVCKIGINVFEPYRGGESHFLFLSVMRAYRHLFGINRFIVERYQFGRNNPEGIASGAYWFYYRLGFRSMRSDLVALAEEEWQKLQSTAGYASPRETLERFTDVHMEMRLPGCPEGYSYCDAADLSKAVTRAIKQRFAGDRARFMAWAVQRVSEALDLAPGLRRAERQALHALAPALALIADLDAWPAEDRAACRRWVLAKAQENELPYFTVLEQHARLRVALAEVGVGS